MHTHVLSMIYVFFSVLKTENAAYHVAEKPETSWLKSADTGDSFPKILTKHRLTEKVPVMHYSYTLKGKNVVE